MPDGLRGKIPLPITWPQSLPAPWLASPADSRFPSLPQSFTGSPLPAVLLSLVGRWRNGVSGSGTVLQWTPWLPPATCLQGVTSRCASPASPGLCSLLWCPGLPTASREGTASHPPTEVFSVPSENRGNSHRDRQRATWCVFLVFPSLLLRLYYVGGTRMTKMNKAQPFPSRDL